MRHSSKFLSALRINSKKLQLLKVAPKVAREAEVTTQMVNKLQEGPLFRVINQVKSKRRRAVIVVNENELRRKSILKLDDGI